MGNAMDFDAAWKEFVFTGVMTGEFQALDGDTGKILWSFQTPSGIIGQPVTCEKDSESLRAQAINDLLAEQLGLQ